MFRVVVFLHPENAEGKGNYIYKERVFFARQGVIKNN